jgi:glycine/D-amino acid oxidase-like deaminating enzyme
VVIGAGLAGLTSARVLADHFDEVLLLDRDHIDKDAVSPPSSHRLFSSSLSGQAKVLGRGDWSRTPGARSSARVLADHFDEVLLLDRDHIDRDAVNHPPPSSPPPPLLS